MADYRYTQFCPVARAIEVVGERWTLLVARELLLGPQRFSDLRRRLAGVSSSVLADRLARLEERGVVARRTLAPPASSTVYELTATGRDLEPVVVALARWGVRFLSAPQPGDHFEPDWLRLGLHYFARRTPTPERSYALRVPDGERELAIRVEGGPGGTHVSDDASPAEVTLRAAPLVFLGLASQGLDPEAAVRDGALAVEGDVAAVADFPRLFDLVELGAEPRGPVARTIANPPTSNPHNPERTSPCPSSTESTPPRSCARSAWPSPRRTSPTT